LRGTWVSDGYRKFYIKDPKPRTIHKASVRDRVLYQAIYRILYPIFDKTFIFDSYSSRDGKSTHIAIKRLSTWIRKLSKNYTKPTFALKCDIRKFFDSIDHEILLHLISQKIDCPDTIKLLEKVIDSFHKTPGKGLPLGNVTSQIFANIYLNQFDWHVKKELGFKYYIRYCDDFVILSQNKNSFTHLSDSVNVYLRENLKLELHPNKIQIRKLHQGIDFLGVVILPHRSILRTKTKNRILKNVNQTIKQVENRKLSKEKACQKLASYLGHLSHIRSRKISQLVVQAQIKVSQS
jgi:retron-type reverse transcriptase